jgi:hypothetical protein
LLTFGVAALVLAALVTVIGQAQAAPSTKVYDASVYVANTAGTKLTLTLKNDSRSKQTLGSANFIAPAGMTLGTLARAADKTGWTASVVGNVVQFRSTSGALTPGGAGVSADVNVSSVSGCSNATWTTQVKQSNDFSGSGNDFAIGSGLSNLRPLGSFVVDPVETVVPADPDDLHVPQILVSQTSPVTLTAYDVCGAGYVNYGSGYGNDASLAAVSATPARLVGATISAISWSTTTAVGTASVTPVVVETGDQLRVSDAVSGTTTVSDDSNVFDVVEKLCTSLDTTCQWNGKQGKITVDASAPPSGDPDQPPSLGIGFFGGDLGFTCGSGGAPVGDTLININPRDYPLNSTVTVTLTYDKSLTGNGPANGFSVCLLKDYGQAWSTLSACASPAVAPCILDRKKVNGGNLRVVLFLKSQDPWGGIKS